MVLIAFYGSVQRALKAMTKYEGSQQGRKTLTNEAARAANEELIAVLLSWPSEKGRAV